MGIFALAAPRCPPADPRSPKALFANFPASFRYPSFLITTFTSPSDTHDTKLQPIPWILVKKSATCTQMSAFGTLPRWVKSFFFVSDRFARAVSKYPRSEGVNSAFSIFRKRFMLAYWKTYRNSLTFSCKTRCAKPKGSNLLISTMGTLMLKVFPLA